MNYYELLREADEIYDFLIIPISDDITEAVEKGNLLSVYIVRTGKMLADAKLILNQSMNNEAVKIIKEITSSKYSAKIQNALIDSVCKDERYLVDHIEQLNKSCKYQLNYCITIISKCKEEMKYLQR